MAQLTGTAARSTSHSSAAFVAGVLLATALMATMIILALAVGIDVKVRDGAAAAHPVVVAPKARAGVNSEDDRLDPIERAYIFHRAISIGLPAQDAPATHAGERGAPRYQLIPR